MLPIDYGPAADPHDGPGEPLVESVWVEPYPDEKLGVEDGFHPATKAHPAFMVEGLDHLLTRLDTAGIRVSEDEVQLEGFHRVYVRDPFGNRIELIEPV